MTTLRITYKRQLSRVFEQYPIPWKEQLVGNVYEVTDATGDIVCAISQLRRDGTLYSGIMRALYHYTRPWDEQLDIVDYAISRRPLPDILRDYPLPWRFDVLPNRFGYIEPGIVAVDDSGVLAGDFTPEEYQFILDMAAMATDRAYRRAWSRPQIYPII